MAAWQLYLGIANLSHFAKVTESVTYNATRYNMVVCAQCYKQTVSKIYSPEIFGDTDNVVSHLTSSPLMLRLRGLIKLPFTGPKVCLILRHFRSFSRVSCTRNQTSYQLFGAYLIAVPHLRFIGLGAHTMCICICAQFFDLLHPIFEAFITMHLDVTQMRRGRGDFSRYL